MKSNLTFLCLIFSFLILITCTKVEKVMLVSTGEITNLLANTADASGDVIDLGSGITEHGHCWGKTPNVSIGSSKTQLGVPPGTGGFTSQLTNMEAGTQYYIKSYATNGKVTVYGKEKNFTTVAASVPILTTTVFSSITATTASTGGNITSDGGAPIIARGVCWGISSNPSTANSKTSDGSGSGNFTSSITNLSSGTIYYVRAYATNSTGTAYGNELIITSGYLLPTITTTALTSITSNSASSGGNISNDGGAAVTARGICWNTTINPTIENNKTNNGAGTGVFVSSITGLTPGATYYVRAYATNSAGTAYGNELICNASSVLPSLTTTAISSITSSTAISGGNITNDGGAPITASGVCWATTAGPDITKSKTSDNTGTGSFTSNIAGLSPGTAYYVRAYATNSAGTAYGNEILFATSAIIPVVTTTTVTNINATTAVSGGNVTSDGGASVSDRGICWSTSPNPTINNNTIPQGTGTGIFISNITGLASSTTYYVRAYAKNIIGIAYGTQVSFTTTIILPVVTTDAINAITATTATSGGTVTSEGGASVTARGVCWSTTTGPTLNNSKTTDGIGTGAFVSSITGLINGITYYVRAYATNSGGTSYGNEVSFTTTIFLPTLTTLAKSNLGTTTANSGGNIFDDGGASVSARGVCWSTSPNPTTSNDKTNNGTGTGSFVSNLTGLTQNTTYYVRAYATNTAGTGYGNEIIIKTWTGTVTDIDGNVYYTLTIGTQIWIAENLKTTRYNDGTAIPNVTVAETWAALITGAYCDYNNTPANSTTYGRLYNWYTVDNNAATRVASNGGKNVCPTSWHVPSDAEWTTLTTYLGGEAVAGGKLKETGTTHWLSPNTDATNETGFTALPGGMRHFSGYDNGVGVEGAWKNSTDYSIAWGGLRYLFYNSAAVTGGYNDKQNGFSVRCIKD
jgi:uncharacterized protein (TIGR02145 family)